MLHWLLRQIEMKLFGNVDPSEVLLINVKLIVTSN